jgi:hypothetical protein
MTSVTNLAVSGVQFKLATHDGALLGLITVPQWIGDTLRDKGHAFFHVYRLAPVGLYSPNNDPMDLGLISMSATLFRSHRMDGTVELDGPPLEEIERAPGFAFAPSIDYMRHLARREAEGAVRSSLRPGGVAHHVGVDLSRPKNPSNHIAEPASSTT